MSGRARKTLTAFRRGEARSARGWRSDHSFGQRSYARTWRSLERDRARLATRRPAPSRPPDTKKPPRPTGSRRLSKPWKKPLKMGLLRVARQLAVQLSQAARPSQAADHAHAHAGLATHFLLRRVGRQKDVVASDRQSHHLLRAR